MNTSRSFTFAAALALAVVLTGCATNLTPGSSAPPAPSANAETPAPAPVPDESETDDDMFFSTTPSASWVNNGAGIVLLTWGSSSCVPEAADVTADGQNVSVTMAPPAGDFCTADMAPRGTYIAVPDSVKRDQPVTLKSAVDSAELGLEVAPTEVVDMVGMQSPTAAWVGSNIALVSWGSSSCRPSISGLSEESATSLTATFAAPEGACTRDLVPRVTLLYSEVVRAGASLTLVGLDGAAEPLTVKIAGAPAA